MKDLKAFMARVEGDSKLAKKLEAAATAEEVVAIAADAGYTFTTDDLMDAQMEQVAGGVGLRDSLNWFTKTFTNTVGDPLLEAVKETSKAAADAAAKTAFGYVKKAGQKVQDIGNTMSNL